MVSLKHQYTSYRFMLTRIQLMQLLQFEIIMLLMHVNPGMNNSNDLNTKLNGSLIRTKFVEINLIEYIKIYSDKVNYIYLNRWL